MRPSFEVADVLRDHLDGYKTRYSLSLVQQKAVQAILNCRTSALGGHVDCCTSCGHVSAISYNSCRNRHCPKCQWSAQQRWIRSRMEELLPVKYFHLVFTVPQELNALMSSNEAKLYGLLFQTAWQTLEQLCSQKEWLGAQPGMIAVLHTPTCRHGTGYGDRTYRCIPICTALCRVEALQPMERPGLGDRTSIFFPGK